MPLDVAFLTIPSDRKSKKGTNSDPRFTTTNELTMLCPTLPDEAVWNLRHGKLGSG